MNGSNTIVIAAAVLALSNAGAASGATPQDVGKLGTTLTEIGAEREGNADGSIPAYTGGLTEAPAGFVKGSGVRPDPFASERPQFSIDAMDGEGRTGTFRADWACRYIRPEINPIAIEL